MAITRNLVVMLKDDVAKPKEKMFIYRDDVGVEMVIELKDFDYSIDTVENRNNIQKAYALFRTPTRKTYQYTDIKISNGKLVFTFSQDVVNVMQEIGEYELQFQLYDKEDNRLTIPSYNFYVKEPLTVEGELVGTAVVDESVIVDRGEEQEYIFIITDGYIKTKWRTGDLITKERLNKVENALSVITDAVNSKVGISQLHNHKNKEILDTISANKINEWDNKSNFDGDYNNLTNKPTIPTKVSDLLNDSGYLTEHQDISGKVDKVDGKSLISDDEIERLSTLKNYDDSNIYLQLNDIESEINELKEGNINLSNYVTKDELSEKADKSELHSHSNKNVLDGITTSKVTEWNNKSTFDGNYNSLTNKPTMPTKTSQLTNDSGFITTVPSEYITETELNTKGYLTQHQDISSKVGFKVVGEGITVPPINDGGDNEIDLSAYAKKTDLDGYVTDLELNSKGYLTEHQDISDKVDFEVIGEGTTVPPLENYDDTEIRESIDEINISLEESVKFEIIGEGTTVPPINGDDSYILPIATKTTLGGVKIGNNLSIDSDGVLSSTTSDYDDTEIRESINEINTSLDNIMTKVNTDNLLLSRLGKKYVNMNDTYNSIQGMTYLENDICVCAYASDKTGNMVRLDKLNIKSGNVIISKELELGHANDMCYDGEFIYVTMAKDYTTNANAKIIFKLNPSDLTLIDTIQNPSTGLNSWGGVAYDNKTKQFFVTSFEERNHCEVYNQNFRYVKTINLKQETYNETGYQTLSAHNGKLYQITINPEVIFEFDVDGNLLKVYNIDEFQGIYKTGELQSLCFREDGRAYLRTVAKLSRLSNGIEQFWLADFKTNVNNSNNRFSSCFGQRSDLTITVDSTIEYYNSTGLSTAPFNSIEEMILSLHAPEFYDEQLSVDIKSNFEYSNLYIIGCNNMNIYFNGNKINSIRLIGCNNVNVYDYKIVGYMDSAQLSLFNSNVKLGGGEITKAITEHTTLIERSTVVADGSSLGIFVENPVITLRKLSTLTVADRDNKTINGLFKDNTSKLKTVRLLKGGMTKTNITLPTDLSNYANVELRFKFPRGYGATKWLDLSSPPRADLVLNNTTGIQSYDGWFNLSGSTLSLDGTNATLIGNGTFTTEKPELLFDIAIWD